MYITDDDADLWSQSAGGSGGVGGFNTFASDFEIVRNRMYVNDSYYSHYGTQDVSGIVRYTSNPATKALSMSLFYVSQGSLGPWRGGPVYIRYGNSGQAATKLNGIDTVWCFGVDNNAMLRGVAGIYRFQDLNGDGDAMDNAAVTGTRDEWMRIFEASSATGTWNDPTTTNILDLELVTDSANHLYLLVLDGNNAGGIGRHLWVMALADNGEYLGGSSSVKLIATVQQGFDLGTEIEFDPTPAPIPEPVTLLTVATAALALIGCVRRRRLR